MIYIAFACACFAILILLSAAWWAYVILVLVGVVWGLLAALTRVFTW